MRNPYGEKGFDFLQRILCKSKPTLHKLLNAMVVSMDNGFRSRRSGSLIIEDVQDATHNQALLDRLQGRVKDAWYYELLDKQRNEQDRFKRRGYDNRPRSPNDCKFCGDPWALITPQGVRYCADCWRKQRARKDEQQSA